VVPQAVTCACRRSYQADLSYAHRCASQETPDLPEALRCVPSLQLADIPKRTSTVPTTLSEETGVSVLRHELFTNDVLYLEAALDLRPVPPSLLHLVPLFCRCS
jgi:Zn-dependent M16 (insulinase) family peptidase